MRLHDVPDEDVLSVPDTVEVVRHEVDPVRGGEEAEDVEVLKVPVGRRCREGEAEAVPGRGELRRCGYDERATTRYAYLRS